MNLPNCLTLSRFVFAVILVVLLVQNSLYANIAALVIFVIASLTDFYDGYFAKKCGLVSNFGKIMDPIADKVLILAVFSVLSFSAGLFSPWMVIAIALREVSVTISRLNAMRQGHVLAAEQAGKIKTVVQILAIFLMLMYLIADQSEFCSEWFYRIDEAWQFVIQMAMCTAVALTIWSGAAYFRSKMEKERAVLK